MDINDKVIKIRGSVSTDRTLALDEDVEFTIKGLVVKLEERSNQDGTKTVWYVVKISELV